MKILLISPLPPPAGGIASWTSSYLKSAQAAKEQVKVVNTAIIGSRTKKLGRRNFVEEIIRTISIIKNVINELHHKNFDIVHLNTSCSRYGLIREIICAKLVKRKKTKLVVHCHCDVHFMVNGNFSRYIFKKLINLSDSIFVLNNSSYQFIYDCYKKQSNIVPNFLTNDVMAEISIIDRKDRIKKNCLFVGHISKQKGCDIILEIADMLPDYNFVMVGLVSDEIKRLKKPVNVEYVGEVSNEEVIEYMQNADTFIFPSLSEGFPVALLEAMACGLPVVATPVGAIPDMIEEQGGIIVKIGNVKEFSVAIRKITSDQTLYDAMSCWNVKKVKNHYSENIVLDILFKKYSQIV